MAKLSTQLSVNLYSKYRLLIRIRIHLIIKPLYLPTKQAISEKRNKTPRHQADDAFKSNAAMNACLSYPEPNAVLWYRKKRRKARFECRQLYYSPSARSAVQ